MSQPRALAALLILVGLALPGTTDALAEKVPARRVLVIGIDGLRPDALRAAKTPHLDALIEAGVFSDTTQILGQRYQKNNTSSGPGWSSFLTGVWADKHGVDDNTFAGKNYDEYPHFFARLKQVFPEARTGSFLDWKPIDDHIVSHADVRKVYAQGKENYAAWDAQVADGASEALANKDLHAVVVYFGAVDVAGHRHGFHPQVKQYIEAIEQTDQHVGQLVAALKSRPHYPKEDWLVISSTDHGGRGKGHGSGHKVPEIRTTFLLVSGTSAKRGPLKEPTYIVDVPVTALVHLGVELDPGWKLDGRAVGLDAAQ